MTTPYAMVRNTKDATKKAEYPHEALGSFYGSSIKENTIKRKKKLAYMTAKMTLDLSDVLATSSLISSIKSHRHSFSLCMVKIRVSSMHSATNA